MIRQIIITLIYNRTMPNPPTPRASSTKSERSDLALYKGSLLDHARQVASLHEDELKRKAALAVAEKSLEGLWEIVLAYLTLYGESMLLTSPHTIRSYRTGVAQFLEHAAEKGWKLLSPRKNDPQLYVNHLLSEGKSIHTVESRVAAARMLYKALRWTALTEADPFADVKVPKERTNPWDKSEPYSDEEVEGFLEFADEQETTLILVLAHGGLRISEALELNWDDLDEGRRRIRVNKGKGRKQRVISMSRSLQEAIRGYRQSQGMPKGRVFSFKGRSGAVKRMEKVILQSGVRFRGFHAFRKHSGTKLMQQVKDIARVAKHLGHSDTNTTRTYAQLPTDDLKDELEKW